MPSFEYPYTIEFSLQGAGSVALEVNGLPTETGTVSLDCDVQVQSPGAILQSFGIEVTTGAYVFLPLAAHGELSVGARFTHNGQLFALHTDQSVVADGGPLDYIKFLAVAVQ